MPPAWRSFLLSVLALLPVAALVFLWDCSFFEAWDGRAVSVAPSPVQEPATYRVRILEGEGPAVRTERWDAEVVKRLGLKVDPVEMAPLEVPETAPRTVKHRLSLSYEVQLGAGTDTVRWLSAPTTSVRSVGVAALVLLVLIAVRNMLVAGSPIALEPLQVRNATAAPPFPSSTRSGGRGRKGARGHKGPPPAKRRRGRGRR